MPKLVLVELMPKLVLVELLPKLVLEELMPKLVLVKLILVLVELMLRPAGSTEKTRVELMECLINQPTSQ